MKRRAHVHLGSRNVFADLKLPDADNLSIQAELVRLVYLRIKRLGLTQLQGAQRLGLKQPDISRLMNGRHTGFSADRLFRFLTALDQDVQIIVRQKPPHTRRSAHISVAAA